MEDKKSIKLLITNLSGRRKVALVIALLLLGAGISDPEFLRDADVAVTLDNSESSGDSFDEIEAMLAEFETTGNADHSSAPPSQSAQALKAETASSVSPSPLTIPQATEPDVFHIASYPESTTQPAPGHTGQMSPDSFGTASAAAQNTTVANSTYQNRSQPTVARIRLTGSILPSP